MQVAGLAGGERARFGGRCRVERIDAIGRGVDEGGGVFTERKFENTRKDAIVAAGKAMQDKFGRTAGSRARTGSARIAATALVGILRLCDGRLDGRSGGCGLRLALPSDNRGAVFRY